MRTQESHISKSTFSRLSKTFVLALALVSIFSCQKTMDVPAAHSQFIMPAAQPLVLQLSVSRLVLLQGNAGNQAFTMTWSGGPGRHNEQGSYTVEAAVRGTGFADAVVVGTSVLPSIHFNVKDFNSAMRRILEPGKASMIDLRVKATYPAAGNTTIYSEVIALEVTPYQEHISYEPMQVIRIPGNYQQWILPCAPKVVSAANNGEYEGYIDFNHPYAQFLMVKAAIEWDPKFTYHYIGSDKFGFGGNVFSVFGGSGVYQFKVNMNTNTWSYTRIRKWELNGSAIAAEGNVVEMKRDQKGVSWHITANLQKGSFRINANGTEAISLGHSVNDPIGVPSAKGDAIQVVTAGNYTIALNLSEAGNYMYSLQRNN